MVWRATGHCGSTGLIGDGKHHGGLAGMLSQNTDEARPMLAQLIEGRLTMTARSNEKGRFYEFRGTGTIEPVIAGTAHKVASPTGLVKKLSGLLRRAA